MQILLKLSDWQTGGDWNGSSGVLQSMFLGEVSENENHTIVLKTKNKTSTGCDGIDMSIVKRTIDCINKPLSYIFNLSCQTGNFPDRLKVAKVFQLFETGYKQILSNYRPVSLLSLLSKLLEKVFVQKLDSFIEKNNLLCES